MSSADVARRYFEAVAARDLDAALAMWAPGGVERVVGQRELTAPDGVRAQLVELHGAFPDLALGGPRPDRRQRRPRRGPLARDAARSPAPGAFQGFVANGARIEIEGCDVLTMNADDRSSASRPTSTAATSPASWACCRRRARGPRQRLTKLANVRTRARAWIQAHEPERIADGVWLVRGGIPKTMNVYLIEDDGGVTVFDAGISDMTAPVARRGRAPGRHQAGRARPRRRRPPRRRAGSERAGVLPPGRARGRRVAGALPPLLGPRQARPARARGAVAAARRPGTAAP